MASQIQLLVLLLSLINTVAPQFPDIFYPENGTALPKVDDGSSPPIELEHPFIFFGEEYTQLYVNVDGTLTFDDPFTGTPQSFPLNGPIDIIAPLWANLDNSGVGDIFYNQYSSGEVLQRATNDIATHFPECNVTAEWVFVATWVEVPYAEPPRAVAIFQAVLISGDELSFFMFNYAELSPRNAGVEAGYDTIDSSRSFMNIPGPVGNFLTGSNVNTPGRWAFKAIQAQQCMFDGEEVQVGDSFWTDNTCRERCTCTSEGLQCQNEPCSNSQVCQRSSFQYSCQSVERGTCTISGDPHYYPFDGGVFHFQGTCTYVLSEQCEGELPYYRVEGSNEHRGNTRVSWTRQVTVFVGDYRIDLVKGHPGEAQIDGIFQDTPVTLSNGTVQVYVSGFFVVISTYFGLEVSYNTNHLVRIRLPFNYQNATCGLCGNFNNNPNDDFQTPDGVLVNSDVDFADSWQVSGDDDEPGCEPECEGLECAECTEEQETLYRNGDHCGILQNTSGPFSACHEEIPPEDFVESCVYDLCVAGGYQPVLCQSLSTYASECQQNGIQPLSWRRPGFCEISCPSNSHFESQGTSCPATCVNPNSPQNCPLPPQESCICDSGFVLSAGVCVPLADCGCIFEGLYYSSGETVILDDDCGRQCSCSRGAMTCEQHACGPLESCEVVEGERGCRPNTFSTCWKKSYGSYQTFDGLKYHYPGACELILVNVTGLSDFPHFVLTMEKVPRGQQGFIHVLNFVTWNTHISIKITKSIAVYVDGQQVRLPYDSASNQIQIYRSSLHGVILRTSFGVTVQTVWPHFISITAPGVYSGSLGGLCGDIDGNPDDDFRTPDGILVDNSQDFGDSWRTGSLFPSCVESVDPGSMLNNNLTELCDILGSPTGPFAQCLAMVDPQPHIDACVEIIRASRDPQSALCLILQDFALMCQQKDIAIDEWRDDLGCEKNCPLNSHYELCGDSCAPTCPSLSFPFTCDTLCQEGCQCDDGLILSDDECVSPPDCGCFYQGQYWQGGEMFWEDDDCQSLCTCDGTTSTVSCVPSSCGPQEFCGVVGGEFGCHPNPHGHCSGSGDPHYVTFDGNAYDFQGTCRYLLMALCNNTEDPHQFSVEVENEPWLGLPVSITAAVYVTVSGYQVHLSGHSVMVNGVISDLPVNLNEGQVSIYQSGSRTVVVSDYGPSVSFDGWRVAVYVPANYSGQTCGLCGNFNGNPNDDFQTPLGVIVATPDEFGTSWKVGGSDTCSDGCGSSCPQCPDETAARAQCGVIQDNDGPLSFCHDVVDPTTFFNDCVYDVCVSGDEGQDILCADIEAYVSACQSAGAQIFDWRQLTPCEPDCQANSHYELCGTDCDRNCVSPHPTCDLPCYEGCFCDEGFARSGTTCVPVESCGCQHNGVYYNAGDIFWLEDCSVRCECRPVNDLRCYDASCTPTQECIIRHGHLGCFDPFSTCTVWGDPHYITFDGKRIDFQGTCTYIITESVSHRPNEIQFGVTATNNHRGNNRVSFVSAADIHVSSGSESVHISIGTSKTTTINGTVVSLPTSVGDFVTIARRGSFVVVNATDLIVEYDGRSTLLVRVNRNRLNRVIGMCGNLNYDPTDDRVFPNGTKAQNDNDFGRSWTSPSSQPGCGSTDEDFDDGLDNCPFLEKFSYLCSIITNTSGPFQACHPHVDPQPFFISCVYDLCHYTKAHGTLCVAVAAYESTCSVLGLNIPEWRPALGCAESDPCEELDCTNFEWCGERKGVYGCFCDEFQGQNTYDPYDSEVTCESSSGYISISRCHLFEAGFDPSILHLQDDSCRGTVKDGRVVFHYDNDDQLCGTVLRSNSTHFYYENAIHGEVDPHDSIISRLKKIYLYFCCVYPLCDALSLGVGIHPLESTLRRKLPPGYGRYLLRLTAYVDPDYQEPLTHNGSISLDLHDKIYIEVQAEELDERQISTVLDSCWATPIDDPDYPVRWDLIIEGCPNPADGTVKLKQNGVSTVVRFSFKIFIFKNYTYVYLHCKVRLCLLRHDNCSIPCHPGHLRRVRKDVTYHDTADMSLGPLIMVDESTDGKVKRRSISDPMISARDGDKHENRIHRVD